MYKAYCPFLESQKGVAGRDEFFQKPLIDVLQLEVEVPEFLQGNWTKNDCGNCQDPLAKG
jgi:hypothetical protein